jgi:hypothetical protein
MSDRQLANESLTSQGIEIPRPDKPEELHYSCGPNPEKAQGSQGKAASSELCERYAAAMGSV